MTFYNLIKQAIMNVKKNLSYCKLKSAYGESFIKINNSSLHYSIKKRIKCIKLHYKKSLSNLR